MERGAHRLRRPASSAVSSAGSPHGTYAKWWHGSPPSSISGGPASHHGSYASTATSGAPLVSRAASRRVASPPASFGGGIRDGSSSQADNGATIPRKRGRDCPRVIGAKVS